MTDATPAEALKLPLCPFCDQQTDWNVDDIDGWIASVSCSGCDMVGPMSEFKYDDPEEAKVDAFARWQRGFPPPPDAGEVRTYREEVREQVARDIWAAEYDEDLPAEGTIQHAMAMQMADAAISALALTTALDRT